MKIMIDSEYLDKLQKSLGVDNEGNAVVGKNLEVDGTTKLNGGFEPIHTYEFTTADNEQGYIKPFFETQLQSGGYVYNFVGLYYVEGVFDDPIIGYGYYSLDNGKIDMFYCWRYDYNSDRLVYDYSVGEDSPGKLEVEYGVYLYDNENTPFKTLFGNQSIVGEGNIDLYRHRIRVNGYQFEYISSSNLVCDSVQDLRTVVKESSSSYVTMAMTLLAGMDTTIGKVEITPSTATVTPLSSGASAINIVNVIDTVTTI